MKLNNKDMKKNELYQCPYESACKCNLKECCLHCETFGEYLNGNTIPFESKLSVPSEEEQYVWILMSVDNDYNQPPKAFEEIWWYKPTYEDLKEYGFTKEAAEAKNIEDMVKPNKGGETVYWIEKFKQQLNQE